MCMIYSVGKSFGCDDQQCNFLIVGVVEGRFFIIEVVQEDVLQLLMWDFFIYLDVNEDLVNLVIIGFVGIFQYFRVDIDNFRSFIIF